MQATESMAYLSRIFKSERPLWYLLNVLPTTSLALSPSQDHAPPHQSFFFNPLPQIWPCHRLAFKPSGFEVTVLLLACDSGFMVMRLLSLLRTHLLFMPPASAQDASVPECPSTLHLLPASWQTPLPLPRFHLSMTFQGHLFLPFPQAASHLYKLNHSFLCAPTCAIYCYSLYHHGSLCYT